MASPTTKSVPVISVCISAGSETGSNTSSGVAEATGRLGSLLGAGELADFVCSEQPVTNRAATTTNENLLSNILTS
jgi:hypothetical protein